ncbi:MAG TPA: glycosyltransferase 87 family protein [Anaerolineales bacterium]|nr:glycosyltransferase 87 family protein [Anaerolineales bacterium]
MNLWISPKRIIGIALWIFCAVYFLTVPISFPDNIGVGDFRPYWSSSFLLRHGQDFSNPTNMDFIERTLTGWDEPFTMYAWFAPTGNLVLLPYTLFSFERAAFYWLITNIFVVFLSVILLCNNAKTGVWIPLFVAFAFSATLHSLVLGQINTLVFLGIVLFLFFSASGNDFAAGTSLALTTIKVHLVILTLPLLIIDAAWRKKWYVLVGFLSTITACAFILFLLYPPWLNSFLWVITSGMSGFREAPTIPGLLVHAGNYEFGILGKWLWVVSLILAITAWWGLKNKLNQRILIDFSILVGILISPIGWSYDHIILLIPLLHVLEWMSNGSLAKKDVIAIIAVLIVVNLVALYERTRSVSEVWFFWVPIIILTTYLFAWKQKRSTDLNSLLKTA